MKKNNSKRVFQVKTNVFPAIIIHTIPEAGDICQESVIPVPMTHLDEIVLRVLPLFFFIEWQRFVGFLRTQWWRIVVFSPFYKKQLRHRPLLIDLAHHKTVRAAATCRRSRTKERWDAKIIEFFVTSWYMLQFGWIIGRSVKWAVAG